MRRRGRIAIGSVVACLVTLSVFAASAALPLPEVETSVDRHQVEVGEALVLQLRLRGAAASEEPDLTPLSADFDVLGVQRVRRMSLVNGARDSSFDFVVQIAPRRTGALVVPALPIGDASSEPLPIQVSAVAAQPPDAQGGLAYLARPVILEARVDRADPYEHERVVLTFDLYTRGEVQDGALAAPEVPGQTLEQLGEDRRIEKWIDGQRYAGIERSYVLVPDTAGTLRVPPVRFEGRVRVAPPERRPRMGGGRFGGSFFDDFFSDAFRDDVFAGFFGSGLRSIAVESPALQLQVRERPAAVAGQWWLPARGVTLTESLEPEPEHGPLRVGEPLTRRIEIRADGVSPAQLPPLPDSEIAGVKHYVEAPAVAENAQGTHRIDETTWIATQPGTLTLPAVELAWWDTQSDSAQKAVLPARSLEVLPALGTPAPPDTAAAAAPAQEPALADATNAPAPGPARLQGRFDPRALAALVATLALSLLGVAVVRRRRAAPRVGTPSRRACVRALRRACRRNDAAGAEAALRSLARPGDVVPEPLAQEVARLMALRYSSASAPWQGAALWQAWRAARKTRRSRARAGDAALPPLYPTP
jgi:hypothetical protein